MSAIDVAAVILAAGSSIRLGQPKQLLMTGSRTLVRAAVEEARQVCSRVAIVVGKGAVAKAVSEAVSDLDVAIVTNDWHAQGMASSVRAGVAWAASGPCRSVVLMACDQPHLDAGHIERLVDAWRSTNRVVGSAYDGVLGVPAVFPRAYFFALLALRGDEGARAILRGARPLGIAWAAGAFDVDTQEDLLRMTS
ncbi:MAG TPA: nucleotidyltransferase family protein [Polyangiaceae bacterium]|jgi:molybdenum cofactor cytidylyltransferase